MKVSVVSYSLSSGPKTIDAWKQNLFDEINGFIMEGSDIILYPELFLMGLSDFFKGTISEQLKSISKYIETELLPALESVLKDMEVLLVLGSGPRIVNGKCLNTAFIWNGSWIYQDKLNLTPWETNFSAGEKLEVFNFKGLKAAVLICFDIEMPSLATSLKEKEVHLVLVPSATTNKNGNQRVNRCANARSVELGAAVITCPLIGDSACEIVDHSEGRQGRFLPSQEVVTVEQEVYSEYSIAQKVIHHYEISEEMLKALKVEDEETKPYLKKENSVTIEKV